MSQIHQEKPSRWFSNAPSVIVVIYFKTIKRGKEKWLHIITVNWLSLVPIQCQQESPFWGAWKRKLYSVQTVRLWYSAAVRTAQSCYSSIKREKRRRAAWLWGGLEKKWPWGETPPPTPRLDSSTLPQFAPPAPVQSTLLHPERCLQCFSSRWENAVFNGEGKYTLQTRGAWHI